MEKHSAPHGAATCAFSSFIIPPIHGPPTARSLDLALEVLRERKLTGSVGIELSQGAQICDRMVGEPTVFTQAILRCISRPGKRVVEDAALLLAEIRAIKTDQEIERMRLANELAAHWNAVARENIRVGMKESEVAAMIEGHIHADRRGIQGQSRDGAGVHAGVVRARELRRSRPLRIVRHREHEPTLVEIWVCADGYWTDLTKNICPGTLTPQYNTCWISCWPFSRSCGHHARWRKPGGAGSPDSSAHCRSGICRPAIASRGAWSGRAGARAAVRASGCARHDEKGNGAGD